MGALVFLVDVDNTLLDNDAIQQDLKDHLERGFGVAARERYWRILEDLFAELGYRDYIGALQRYRAEHPRDVELLSMSSFLMDYPFAKQLFPGAIEVLKRLRNLGPTVILSDGDVVFQPRKVEHAGLSEVVSAQASQDLPTPHGPVISRFWCSAIHWPPARRWNRARSRPRGVR